MNKKQMTYLLSSFFLSMLTIFILHLQLEKRNKNKNGFTRNFRNGLLQKIKDFYIGPNAYYFSGVKKNHVYFGNYNKSGEIISIGYNFSDTHHIQLCVSDTIRFAWGATKIFVDSPNISLIEGITPLLLKCTFSDNRYKKNKIGVTRFDLPIPISQTSLVCRTYNDKLQSRVLLKIAFEPTSINYTERALEKQGDGIFSVDGMILFDQKTSKLLYIYFYRNQFICLDTNLNIKFIATTIDTNSHAQIKLNEIASDKIITFSAPPRFVNKHGFAYNDKLFNHSEIKADNERIEIFNANSAIDVYSLKNSAYLYSFYLPNPKGEKLRDLIICDDHLIALYKKNILVYKLFN